MPILATDSFTYVNGDLHAANAHWVYEPSGEFHVASHAVYGSIQNPGAFGAYRDDVVWPNDQSSSVTAVVGGGATGHNCGPAVRLAAGSDSFYGIQYASDRFRIIQSGAGGIFGTLASGSTFPVTGDTVALTVVGTTLKAYINGVLQLTATDSAIASGNAGIMTFGKGQFGNVNGFSSWSGGAFTMTFSISGSVGAAGAGATITLSGAGSATTTTDSSGNFSFTGLAPGVYFVTPSMIGRAFAPSTQTITITITRANVTGVNFLTFRPHRSTAILVTNFGPLIIR